MGTGKMEKEGKNNNKHLDPKNPRALLALVEKLLIFVFHFKSLVIVTPRY